MIAMLPVIVIYAFFSETMIKGMTAGAVRQRAATTAFEAKRTWRS